MFFVLSVTLQL